jgi:SAM-dependent methyltransferase
MADALVAMERQSQTVDATVPDLEIMQSAANYHRWLLEQVAAETGRRVLEVGAGIGNYTQHLLDRELVVCVEPHGGAAARLRQSRRGDHNVVVVEGDICDPALASLACHRCDTAICFNVLEHIADERAALTNIARVLVPGGRLLLIVPALPVLFGSIDRVVGHHRRYLPGTLRRALETAGYRSERMQWLNLFGVLPWLVNNRILRRQQESAAQICVYNRYFVPCVRWIERRVRPPVGLSLVAVATAPSEHGDPPRA